MLNLECIRWMRAFNGGPERREFSSNKVFVDLYLNEQQQQTRQLRGKAAIGRSGNMEEQQHSHGSPEEHRGNIFIKTNERSLNEQQHGKGVWKQWEEEQHSRRRSSVFRYNLQRFPIERMKGV